MKRADVEKVIESVCEYLETRACDPWDDELWPAANNVLTAIVAELRELDSREWWKR